MGQDGEIVTIWRLRPRGMESFPHFPRAGHKRAKTLNICAAEDPAAGVTSGKRKKQRLADDSLATGSIATISIDEPVLEESAPKSLLTADVKDSDAVLAQESSEVVAASLGEVADEGAVSAKEDGDGGAVAQTESAAALGERQALIEALRANMDASDEDSD